MELANSGVLKKTETYLTSAYQLKMHEFTALLRNQQRMPANPQMPSVFMPSSDLFIPWTQLP